MKSTAVPGEERARLFDKLKPYCIEVSKHALVSQESFDPKSAPLEKALAALVKVLNNLSPDERWSINTQLGDYIMFPIRHVLSKEALGDRISELVLDVISFVFKTAYSTSTVSDSARQFIAVAIYLMSGPPPEPTESVVAKDKQASGTTRRFQESSSELKTSAFRTLSEIIKAAKLSKASLADIPSATYIVSLALFGIEFAGSVVELQLEALRALECVVFDVMCDSDKSALYLPGIVSTLVKLATGKLGKSHFSVIARSLDILGKIISACFDDADLQKRDPSGESETDGTVTTLNGSTRTHVRTEAWLNGTKHQIRQSLEALSPLRYHLRIEVQRELLMFYQRLVIHCQNSLENCSQLFVDNIVFFASNDDLKEIVQEILNQWSLAATNFESVFEPRVYDWIESLPRVLSSQDSQKAVPFLEAIRFSTSYLTGSPDEMQILEKLARVLVASLQVEPVKTIPAANFAEVVESVTGDLTLPVRSTSSDLLLPDIGVLSELPAPTQRALAGLLVDIGASPMGIQLLRILIEWIQLRGDVDIGLYWVLVCVLRGAARARSSSLLAIEDKSSIQSADVVLDIVDLTSDLIGERFSSSTAQACLSLDAISSVALYLGEEFRYALVETLFPVVELLGSDNGFIVSRARMAVIQISRSCGYSSVRAALVDNADYIVDGVSSRLASLDLAPSSPLILATLVKLAGPSVAVYLDDLIATMFSILDSYHGYTSLVQGIVQLFYCVVEEIAKTLQSDHFIACPQNLQQLKAHCSSLDELLTALDRKPVVSIDGVDPIIVDDVADFHSKTDAEKAKAFGKREKIPDIEPESVSGPEVVKKGEWASEVSRPTYNIIRSIVERCSAFLTHETPSLRYRLLDLLQLSIPILATSKDDFLPVINTYWPLVASRLEDSDFNVVDKALECIGQTCKYSDEFMSSRITNVWPVIVRLIPSQHDAVRTHSSGERTLRSLELHLSVIFSFTPLSASLVDDAVRLFAPFMRLELASSLQIALEHINPDAVWLALHQDDKIAPPSCVRHELSHFP